ncbi:MAG: HupE/UreJ family protein [Betaproteobacteria bacterium]|nr:MAG: HupE/UreJ family protein [Betaproteobacteria bacterium]
MRLALALLACLLPLGSWAHKPSDSYLSLELEGIELRGRWDIALRDLEYALALDANGDGAITWGEVRRRHPDIAAYALSRLELAAGSRPCALVPTAHQIDNHSDGAYAVLRFRAECGGGEIRSVKVGYRLFFDLDPTHRGLLSVSRGSSTRAAVLSPEQATQEFPLADEGWLAPLLAYAREGVWHIWIGIDHVLFLVSLLLPAVFVAVAGGWQPATRFRPVFWDVFKVVTAFTLAHSVTLSLAALAVIELPSRLVESAIALSVVLAALNNLWPVVRRGRWLVAFGFGLVHGFGFASVLADLGLPRHALLPALVGFNLGVEAGQLLIVAAFLPLAYGLRRTWLYRRLLFTGGSTAIAGVAALWMLERLLDIKILAG